MTFESMMEELRKEYLSGLPDKIKQISENLSQKKSEELRDDFHKLKGTGKTYGIPEISELGEVVEKLCLQNSTAMEEVIPPALNLLKQIHAHRLANQAFIIEDDLEFNRIKGLLAGC